MLVFERGKQAGLFLEIEVVLYCNKESRGAVAPLRRTLDWGVTGRRGAGHAEVGVSRFKAML